MTIQIIFTEILLGAEHIPIFCLAQAVLETQAYLNRLSVLFLGSFALLGGPIAYQTFDPLKQVSLTCC